MKKWNPDQPMDELLIVYRSNFIYTHGYSITYFPANVTKEWLVDQLSALDWYQKYDLTTKKPEEATPKPVKRKSKPICPF